MSFHRTVIVAFAAVFTVAMTSLASACCVLATSNSPNPVPLAPAPIYVGPWSGGWSLTPWSFGASLVGSGGCGCCGWRSGSLAVLCSGPRPGLYRPLVSWRPFATYTPAISFPYVAGCCGYGVAHAKTRLPTKATPLAQAR